MVLTRSGRFSLGAAVLVAMALSPRAAHAHFTLDGPACYSHQDGLGSPQKSEPCGQADPGVPLRLTNMVTTYTQGQTITLNITEVIFHPGHYRVSIAQNLAAIPGDPVVTPAADTPCGSTVIESNPTLPLLADGLLVHTDPFGAPQTMQVTLPPNFTCTNCVLQVTQFMSNHPLNNPGGCFYHHCATISVVPPGTVDAGPSDGNGTVDAGLDASAPSDGGMSVDSATTSGPDAATTANPARGCGCRVGAPRQQKAWFAGFFALALAARRRRRG